MDLKFSKFGAELKVLPHIPAYLLELLATLTTTISCLSAVLYFSSMTSSSPLLHTPGLTLKISVVSAGCQLSTSQEGR